MTRLVIFAKAPIAGSAKTRLIPALGADGAAALARQMLNHTLAQALGAGAQAVELCMTPAPLDAAWRGVPLPAAVPRSAQGDGDLGARMSRATERALAQQQGPVLLMGTDCQALSTAHIAEAARQLDHHDAVLLPAFDGGYVLIGLQIPQPSLFTDMAWSTPVVANETLHRMARLGLRVWVGPLLHDVDDPADLMHLPAGFSRHPFFERNKLLAQANPACWAID